MSRLEVEHQLTHAMLGVVTVGLYTSAVSEWERAVVLRYGDIALDPPGPVPVRVHSACMYGEVLLAADCDCRSQVEHAFQAFLAAGRGLFIYLSQEGRGAGLLAKATAYRMQQVEQVDTVEAYHRLRIEPDQRDYTLAGEVLLDQGVRSIALLTNNFRKIEQLAKLGLAVTRTPSIVPVTAHNQAYLRVKEEKLGHDLGLSGSTAGNGPDKVYSGPAMIE